MYYGATNTELAPVYTAGMTSAQRLKALNEARAKGYVIPMVVQDEAGRQVQIDDLAQQRAYLIKIEQGKTPSQAIDELTAEAKAGIKPGAKEGVTILPTGQLPDEKAAFDKILSGTPTVKEGKIPVGLIAAALAGIALFLSMKG